MLSNESLHPPMYSRSNSQASVDSTSMEDFWCEVENIKESTEDRQDDQTLLEVKLPDGEHTHIQYILNIHSFIHTCMQVFLTLPYSAIGFRAAYRRLK